jgi:putative PIN family toxin of toxin-antitoxin system
MTGKVVFDTSTLVSAALRPDSIPDRALTSALVSFRFCASAEALEELERVLKRQRFDSYVDLESRMTLVGAIRTHAQFFIVPESLQMKVRGSCRDAKDEFILALALASEADLIVSSDHDLLVLHPWRGISIMTPAQFLEQFVP